VIKPAGFDKWNPAWRGAYRKGWEAAQAGQPITACPYVDKRKWDGRLTWSRAFQGAWFDGWNAARQADPINTYYSDRRNSGNSALEAHR
jgi:hypothetical protein